MKFWYYTFIVLCSVNLYKFDIPVHCVKSQVEGIWDFKSTASRVKTGGKQEEQKLSQTYKETCGHPNPSHESSAFKYNMDQSLFTDTFSVNLKSDFTADYLNGNGDIQKTGKWTMIYDEGFDFSFGEINTKEFSTYFIFNKYGRNDFKSFQGMTSKWVSYCETTLIGWYQIGDSWGCFTGTKRGGDPNKATNGEATNKQVVVEGSMTSKVFLQTNDRPRFMQSKFGERLHLTSKFKDHAKFVQRINADKNLTWKAAVYQEFEGKTIEELNKIAGRKNGRSDIRADFHFKETNLDKESKDLYDNSVYDKLNNDNNLSRNNYKMKKRNKFRFKNGVIETKSDSKNKGLSKNFPDNFSWKKYIGTAKSQGSCGSCFAVSTISMLEARFRIMYKDKLAEYFNNPNEDFRLSVNHVLKCSVYNQGCDGGYSYLVSKFFHQFEIHLDKCFDKNAGSCHQTCSGKNKHLNNLKLGVKNYYYVGGAYGLTNEQNLMQDLMTNGPIVVSFEPDYSFMSYKSGIYDFNKTTWLNANASKPEWQKVDHSVLLIGWGEETLSDGRKAKYWELQNSWGQHWGESGFVRFRRGIDLNGIESIGEAAIPSLS